MSNTPVQLGDAITQLRLKASPILFCDTCFLLDIIRIPSRVTDSDECSRILTAITSIFDKAGKGEISLVIPPLVESEWQKHASQIKDETNRDLKLLQRQFEVVRIVSKQQGLNIAQTNVPSNEVADYLYKMSESILKLSIHIALDDSVSLLATNRAIWKTAPATQGAVPDCLVYEHSLHIMKELRNQAFVPPLVLATSNTKDFGEGKNPKPPINTELSSVQAALRTTWYWAYSELFPSPPKKIAP